MAYNAPAFSSIIVKVQAMIDSGNIPPQYTESQLAQLVFNNRLDAGLTIFFMVVVVVLVKKLWIDNEQAPT